MKEVAASAIDALKSSPAMLVLVMLQAGVLALVYFTVTRNNELWQIRQMALIERCLK